MEKSETQCPVEVTVNLVGGKWKLVILNQLATHGFKRFNELRRIFPDITQRTLTRQLRELEDDGLVNRKIYPEVPPKVEYSLTKTGESLIPLLLLLRDWGISYMEQERRGISQKETM
ncbi:winged helix-turn-helix transcriptional regulator [Paenibacillus eucommiae]|uniref:DNA-binding HxlR family transcriptional regulator n=1 Tax=Paenibacillus eucommiae TaxID=1355755 RepID=A0ABS4IXM1_9BACL|nr:helix-turn-helix domain-containing protein [Paenibacillus eucommiae]MBP1992329.1 DNA-binding HxlR family transcriptional regulator [Paenibacillus eucommiae]